MGLDAFFINAFYYQNVAALRLSLITLSFYFPIGEDTGQEEKI